MTDVSHGKSFKPGRRRRGRPRKQSADKPSPGQIRRMEFLERAVLWAGTVGRRTLATAFDVSVNHVTQDFSRYRRIAPRNLLYDVSAQCYRPTPSFRPLLAEANAIDTLDRLATAAELSSQERRNALGFDVPIAAIRALPTGLDVGTLCLITRAITAGTGLELTYQSLSTQHPTRRCYWPQALLFTGFRWLARGWDIRHSDWTDLALVRMTAVKPVDDTCPVPVGDDHLWHELRTLEITPNASLSDAQRDIVAFEYGMSKDERGNWVVRMTVRRAMVPYVLDYFYLRPQKRSDAGSVRPITLRNFEEVVQDDRRSEFASGYVSE